MKFSELDQKKSRPEYEAGQYRNPESSFRDLVIEDYASQDDPQESANQSY